MTKKKEWTISSVKREANKLIKTGLKQDEIAYYLRSKVPDDVLDQDMLLRLVEECVELHPNYDLIQDIVASEMAINKEEKGGKIYCFQRDKLRTFTINRDHISNLFTKFDYSSKVRFCSFVYNPDVFDKFYKDGGHWAYNLFEPPSWLRDHFYFGNEIEPCKLPEMYRKYFEHFTNGHKESYEYVLDWLANGLRRRNYCMLVAIAKPGVGKGVLGSILHAMFGSSYESINGEKFNKEFNKGIENRRMIFVDELKIHSQDQEDRIKVLINDYINVEAKGEDSRNVKNYASIYIASNNMDAVPLTADDRRFSIVEMSDKKLTTVFNTDEIKELFKQENVEMLARFLWHRKIDKEKMMHVFVTKRTEEVRRARLKGWQEFFIDTLCDKYKGTRQVMTDITEEITDEYGSRTRPTQKAFKDLEDRYPDRFRVVRPDINGKRIYCLEFR